MSDVLRTLRLLVILFFFFFNDTATTEIYTLSLHDALPILLLHDLLRPVVGFQADLLDFLVDQEDRKSTRLNSSHVRISYAVFCLKKKKNAEVVQRDVQDRRRTYSGEHSYA